MRLSSAAQTVQCCNFRQGKQLGNSCSAKSHLMLQSLRVQAVAFMSGLATIWRNEVPSGNSSWFSRQFLRHREAVVWKI